MPLVDFIDWFGLCKGRVYFRVLSFLLLLLVLIIYDPCTFMHFFNTLIY